MAINYGGHPGNQRQLAMGALRELSRRYEESPDQFSDNDAEFVARAAFEAGVPFDPETKKTEKFFFDLADTALLGLIPNEWRPERIAEDIYGESQGERFVGDMAGLMGLLIPGAAAYKGIGAIRKSAVAAGGYKEAARGIGRRGLERSADRMWGGVGNVGGIGF